MTAKQITVGRWYETTLGVGICRSKSDGRIELQITRPIPRGIVYLTARQVLLELPEPAR